MPLLSLPVELVHRIIYFTSASDEQDLDNCYCEDRHRPHIVQTIPHCCTAGAMTSLAHTSQILRALSLPLMYASVIAFPEYLPSLHAQLTSCPGIAPLVRRMTIFLADGAVQTSIREILSSCVNLHHLRLNGSGVFGPGDLAGFHPGLFEHLSPASQRSFDLCGFMHGGLVPYLKHLSAPANGFLGLQTIRIHEAPGLRRIAGNQLNSALPELTADPETQLASVRTLIFHSSLFEMLPWRTQCYAGAFIAETMPHVQVLDLKVGTFFPQAMVDKFVTLGTNLTDLTVHFDEDSGHMCYTIVGLAPKLRRFVSHGGTACQGLFKDTQWGCVVEFSMQCEVTCDGVKPELLREALVRLVDDRPAVNMSVATHAGQELVSWNCPGMVNCVVPLEVFQMWEALEVEFQSEFGESEPDSTQHEESEYDSDNQG